MTTQGKLVSIGMPLYNGAASLREALDSLLAQDYRPLELQLSDNASTDDTWAICQEYSERHPNIRCSRMPRNLGGARNFEEVLRGATGEYFMWAAHDDLWEPGFVSACVQALEHAPEAILAYPRIDYITPDGEVIARPEEDLHTVGLPPVDRYLKVAANLNRCAPIYGIWRREAIRETVLGSIIGHDIPFMLKASQLGEFCYLDRQVLFYNRIFPDRDAEFYAIAIDPANKDRPLRMRFAYSELILHMLRMVVGFDLPLTHRLRMVVPTLGVCKQFFGLSWLREIGLERPYKALRDLLG